MKELSERSKWHVSNERRLELEHFVRQYDDWHRAILDLNLYSMAHPTEAQRKAGVATSQTEKVAISLTFYKERINLVNRAAAMTDPMLAKPILFCVMYRLPYDKINAQYDVPCGRDMFYDKVRQFIWTLDKLRN